MSNAIVLNPIQVPGKVLSIKPQHQAGEVIEFSVAIDNECETAIRAESDCPRIVETSLRPIAIRLVNKFPVTHQLEPVRVKDIYSGLVRVAAEEHRKGRILINCQVTGGSACCGENGRS